MNQLTPIAARQRFTERYLLTFGLKRKPIKFFCQKCGKFLSSDIFWICAYCNAENDRTKIYSILNKCERCKQPPKSFCCPHCGEIDFLTKQKDSRHPAKTNRIFKAKIEPTSETPSETRSRITRKREDQKAELDFQILCARLDLDLAAIKSQREMFNKKSPEEMLQDDLKEHDFMFMAVERMTKELLQKYGQEFINDPEMLEKAHLWIKAWKLKHMK